MKTYSIISTSIAIIAIILCLIQCESAKNKELIIQAKESVAKANAIIEEQHHLKEIAKRDSVIQAQKNLIADKNKTINKVNDRIESQANAAVRRDRLQRGKDTVLVTSADTALLKKDTLITNLKQQNKDNIADYEGMLKFSQDQTDEYDSLYQNKKKEVSKLEDDKEYLQAEVENERDKEFGISLHSGYGAVVTNDGIKSGPGVSLGLSYTPKWARFSLKRKKR